MNPIRHLLSFRSFLGMVGRRIRGACHICCSVSPGQMGICTRTVIPWGTCAWWCTTKRGSGTWRRGHAGRGSRGGFDILGHSTRNRNLLPHTKCRSFSTGTAPSHNLVLLSTAAMVRLMRSWRRREMMARQPPMAYSLAHIPLLPQLQQEVQRDLRA